MSSIVIRSTLLSFGLGLALLYVLTLALPAKAQTATALLSKIGQTSAEQAQLANGAQPFRTGANTDGYVLTSIEINTDIQAGAMATPCRPSRSTAGPQEAQRWRRSLRRAAHPQP